MSASSARESWSREVDADLEYLVAKLAGYIGFIAEGVRDPKDSMAPDLRVVKQAGVPAVLARGIGSASPFKSRVSVFKKGDLYGLECADVAIKLVFHIFPLRRPLEQGLETFEEQAAGLDMQAPVRTPDTDPKTARVIHEIKRLRLFLKLLDDHTGVHSILPSRIAKGPEGVHERWVRNQRGDWDDTPDTESHAMLWAEETLRRAAERLVGYLPHLPRDEAETLVSDAIHGFTYVTPAGAPTAAETLLQFLVGGAQAAHAREELKRIVESKESVVTARAEVDRYELAKRADLFVHIKETLAPAPAPTSLFRTGGRSRPVPRPRKKTADKSRRSRLQTGKRKVVASPGKKAAGRGKMA